MKFYHADVFSVRPFGGNGLTVVILEHEIEKVFMQSIASEMKQFETIFLQREQNSNQFITHIFTVEEELDFAGHPILGAAAVLHNKFYADKDKQDIVFNINGRLVFTDSVQTEGHFEVKMNQGVPIWGKEISMADRIKYCEALHIKESALCSEYPMEVVSTGLPYLIIPLQQDLEQVKIVTTNLEAMLAKNGAKFVYVFDTKRMEGRTWDNLGNVEDVATGSAAGPTGAYLFAHHCFERSEILELHQGSYVNRPSAMKVSCKEETGEIVVAGDVIILAEGDIMI